MKEKEDSLFNILDMRNNTSFNNDYDNLNIDETAKQKNHPLLSISTLCVHFTSHTLSILLYEIVKLSQEFPDSSTMDIKHPQGSSSKLINIPK